MSAKVTASEVNKLRSMTGAGVMDCKRALVEASGSVDRAIGILRKKGEKISSLRADKATTEGYIAACVSNDAAMGFLFALTCETDFVARNSSFRDLAVLCVRCAMQSSCQSIGEIETLAHEGTTLGQRVSDLMGQVGEKLTMDSYKVLSGRCVVPYVHMGSKLGVLVALDVTPNEKAQEVGRNIAMQVAAMNPIAISREMVPQKIIDNELAVARALAKKEGKPEQMMDKIAMGRLNKFFKESTLLSQQYIKDSKISVDQYLKALPQPIGVQRFERLSIPRQRTLSDS